MDYIINQLNSIQAVSDGTGTITVKNLKKILKDAGKYKSKIKEELEK
jgi:hypothetical protein